MWSRSIRAQAGEEEGECSFWDVHGGFAGGSGGPGSGFTALGVVKHTIKLPNSLLFRPFRCIYLMLMVDVLLV